MATPISIPCEKVIRGCDCTLDPVSNYSSEDPDQQVFYGHYGQPPTHGTFFAPFCFGFCESTDSQEDADLCAARAAIECSLDGAPDDGNPLWSSSRQRFGNSQATCDAECPDTTCPQTAIVAPGTVVSAWQADANARAESLACQQADDLLICFLTTSPLTAGNVDAPYSAQIVTFGGTHTPTFSIVAGSLPPGLVLDASSGFITGTPTTAASYGFTVRLTTPTSTCERAFSITVNGSCGVTTDWCLDPGACRLRVASFNALDWVAGTFPPPFEANPCDAAVLVTWDGTFPNKYQIGGNPCVTYDALATADGQLPFFSLDYESPPGRWVLNFSTVNGTMAFYTSPVSVSPLGITFTRDPDFSCTGPPTLTLEAYSP